MLINEGCYYEIIYENNYLDPKKDHLWLRCLLCLQLYRHIFQHRAGFKLYFLFSHWRTGSAWVVTRLSRELIIHRMRKGLAAFLSFGHCFVSLSS